MKFNQVAFDMIRPMPPFKRALRDANRKNLKTQTRRVMDPQPNGCFASLEEYQTYSRLNNDWIHWNLVIADKYGEFYDEHGAVYRCPYGHRRDLRYMREPLYHGFGGVAYYQDDDRMVTNLLTGEPITWKWKVDVLSQLFMPKIAARTFKRYDFIRAERLKAITEADAMAEGVTASIVGSDLDPLKYRAGFQTLWNSINDRRGFVWDDNPYVWVIGYHDEFQEAAS